MPQSKDSNPFDSSLQQILVPSAASTQIRKNERNNKYLISEEIGCFVNFTIDSEGLPLEKLLILLGAEINQYPIFNHLACSCIREPQLFPNTLLGTGSAKAGYQRGISMRSNKRQSR
jgi:hypothetical protein